MCIICSSAAGVRQPTEAEISRMFSANPDGAGYMRARDGRVEISKGFMTLDELLHALRYEGFTDDDAVVYHFRISTQAGVNPEMTHPFPITRDIEKTKLIDVACPIGAAHNGVIALTSNHFDKEYSDTAHYVAEFLRYLVRTPDDLRRPEILRAVERTTRSKWALMDGDGYIATVGEFIRDKSGLLFSNSSYRHTAKSYKVTCNLFDDCPF